MAEVTFINCPICNEPDMRCETEPEGFKLITCVNHGCASNGGAMNVTTHAARLDERERCSLLADALATRWERSARRLREDGSYWGQALWPPFRSVKLVRPKWEEAARGCEAGAHGLRTISRGCKAGWDPRKFTDEGLVKSPPPLPDDVKVRK